MTEPSPELIARFLPLTNAQIWQAWRELPTGFRPHYDHMCDFLNALNVYRRSAVWKLDRESAYAARKERAAQKRREAEAAADERLARRAARAAAGAAKNGIVGLPPGALLVRRDRPGPSDLSLYHGLGLPRPMLTLDDYDAGRYTRIESVHAWM